MNEQSGSEVDNSEQMKIGDRVNGPEEITVGSEYYPNSLVYGHEGHRTVFTVVDEPYQGQDGEWRVKVSSKYLNLEPGDVIEVSLAQFNAAPSKHKNTTDNWLEKKLA